MIYLDALYNNLTYKIIFKEVYDIVKDYVESM